MTLKSPKEFGKIPLNLLSLKSSSTRFEALDILSGIFPTKLFLYIIRRCRLGRLNPIFDGSMPEREFWLRIKNSNVEMLKIFEGTGPLKLLFRNCKTWS
jgi:hypothetical protein